MKDALWKPVSVVKYPTAGGVMREVLRKPVCVVKCPTAGTEKPTAVVAPAVGTVKACVRGQVPHGR